MKTSNLRTSLVIACTVLYLCLAAQAQNVIYALSYVETAASFHARYPTGALGATTNDKLAMLRQFRKTEIYSVSVLAGKPVLLFSDAGLNIEIRPAGWAQADKAYMNTIRREWRTAPIPGAYADPEAVYEISLDGSRRFRRLVDKQENQAPILLNGQHTKALVEAFVNGKYTIAIYNVPSWNRLCSWELTKITAAHCPDCMPLAFGWLADGNRLFFNLDLGDDDSIDPSNHNVPGIYLVSDDGTDLGGLSPSAPAELAGYAHANYAGRNLLAQLPDGSYLFQDYYIRKGRSPGEPEPFLVISNPEAKAEKHFPLKPRTGSWSVSPSGKYLACIEERQVRNYQTERHLWVKNLDSGEEKELAASPAPNPPTSPEPNIMLTVLGWAP